MNILVLADHESRILYDFYNPERLKDIDLIISCGDLDPEYLSFFVTLCPVPLLYVRGNHDGKYQQRPPEGCTCIENDIYVYKGVRILGLGGSMQYIPGAPNQYTERQMRWRLLRAELAVRLAGGVDIVLTHAPPRGFGDAEDYAHRGFEAFFPFLDRFKPAYLIHGHVHMNYGLNIPRKVQRGCTTIINAWERYALEV